MDPLDTENMPVPRLASIMTPAPLSSPSPPSKLRKVVPVTVTFFLFETSILSSIARLAYHVMLNCPSPSQASKSVRIWRSAVEAMLTAAVPEGHEADSPRDMNHMVSQNANTAIALNLMEEYKKTHKALVSQLTSQQLRMCCLSNHGTPAQCGATFSWRYERAAQSYIARIPTFSTLSERRKGWSFQFR